MKTFTKILKWTTLTVLSVLIFGILFVRFTRKVDLIIYQSSHFDPYPEFTSNFKVIENFVEVEEGVKLHTVLFQPDSGEVVATIFHCLGKGGNLQNVQNWYHPLLEKGFQIYSFEYRGFGLSDAESINSQVVKSDVLTVFDAMLEMPSVKNKPVIVWGRSLGSAFATMTASANNDKISGLVLEGAFSSFPDIAKKYAFAIHLENLKWLVPLVMNNDFPADEEIAHVTKPIVIIHSTEDTQWPFYLGKKLFDASNKENTRFWEVKGKHINGIKLYTNQYVKIFEDMVKPQ